MAVKSYEVELMKLGEYRAHKALILYIPPILLLFGTFGNTISFIILTRQPMRKYSTYIYLAVLSVADTCVLYIGLLRLWLGEIMGSDLRDNQDWSCKVIHMLGYTASDYSVWLIIAVTVERYIVTCHPLKAPTLCKTRRAALVVTTILAVLLLVNLHFLWTVQVVYQKHGKLYITQCAASDGFRVLVEDIWPWLDSFIYSFIPFIVIVILNSLIVSQVIRARRIRNELINLPECLPTLPDQRRRSGNQNDSNRLTIMLLTISFTFLITTLPMNISLIVMSFTTSPNDDLHYMGQLRLFQTITELLMYLNHSCNFYLYCATGRKFRHQLMMLLCRRLSSDQQPITTETYVYAHSFSNTNGIAVRLHEPDMPTMNNDQRNQTTQL